MKNITEIDPIEYIHYCLTEESGDVAIKYFTSVGYIDVDPSEYDCFETSAGTLIAYKVHNPGYHNYVYFSGSDEKYIESIPYEGIENIFDPTPRDRIRMFSFMDSQELPSESSYKQENIPVEVFRCDYNKYGPRAFYPIENSIHLKQVRCILDVTGVGHIMCLDTLNTENPNPLSQSANTGGRTLTGVLKTIYEWSTVNDEPFNNEEPISQKAKEFLDKVQIPDDVMQEVLDSQVDMRVSRYLQGETRNGYTLLENDTIPDSLKIFFYKRCRYFNLFNMKQNHPNGAAIPDSIIQKEKESISKKIFEFCLVNSINFDNYQEILDYFAQYPNEELERLTALYHKIG